VSWPDVTAPPEVRPWRLLDAIAAFGGGIVGAFVGIVAGEPYLDDATLLFGVVIPAQSFGMLAVVALIARRRPPWRHALRWSIRPPDSIGLLIGAGIQIGAALVVGLLVDRFGWELPTQDLVEQATEITGAGQWALLVAGVVVLGPIAEEVVFRGVALRGLETRYGRRIAVYVSAALFSAVHLLDPAAIAAAPIFFVLGVVLGNEVIRTGRLGRAVAIHMGFNLITVVALAAG
jgi:membrane protease YdiL (CAAX protease family)